MGYGMTNADVTRGQCRRKRPVSRPQVLRINHAHAHDNAPRADPTALFSQTDWPSYGHDAGATRYSPLKQINTKNVSQLHLAWMYETDKAAGDDAPKRASLSETTPLVIGNVMYMSTPYNRVVALEPETGKEIWKYKSPESLPIAASRIGQGMAGLQVRSFLEQPMAF